MNNKISPIYSWPAIIIAFVIFWPIGLFLLVKRFSLDKKTALTVGSSVLMGFGYFIAITFGIAFIGMLTDPETVSSAVVSLFFALGGIIMILKANKQKKFANSIKQYISIIINNQVRQLDSVAMTVNKPLDIVKEEIQTMIEKGYLKNAYINEYTREVVLANAVSTAPVNDTYTQPVYQATPSTAIETRVVACPCCGANNTISGSAGECEYCGSALK